MGSIARFGPFELDLEGGVLRRRGIRIQLQPKSFLVLRTLLEHPGDVVNRDELKFQLWPDDTFVEFEANLNVAVRRLRAALSDDAQAPRYIETLPRRGYRFVANVEWTFPAEQPFASAFPTPNRDALGDLADNPRVIQTVAKNGYRLQVARAEAKISSSDGVTLGPVAENPGVPQAPLHYRKFPLWYAVLIIAAVSVAVVLFFKKENPGPLKSRPLTRLTFDDGLQIGATWSPDGRFIAYSSDRGGKFDIWVQQVSGGDPVQITKGPGANWQPEWSPDGRCIAYRSESGGGLFIIPALGGEEKKISSFGYYPRWSPDGSQILFQTHFSTLVLNTDRFYVVKLNGSPPQEILSGFIAEHNLWPAAVAWHPDGTRVSVWVGDSSSPSPSIWTVPIAGGVAVKSEIAPAIDKELREVSAGVVKDVWPSDFLTFLWNPLAKFIYFERPYQGATNIWRMNISSATLRATAVERVTTGAGPDTQATLSPDRKRLAFTIGSQHIRSWLFPFNATTGRIRGSGQAITSPGSWAFEHSLSRDGKKLAFRAIRGGRERGLWEKSLVDGREAPVVSDDNGRQYQYPQWSPDGTTLAYTCWWEPTSGQLMLWHSNSRTEEPLAAPTTVNQLVYDWSPNGKQLLVSKESSETHREEVWLYPVAGAPHAENVARRLIFDPAYDLWQPHFSPDARWIVFEAVANSAMAAESSLYVIPAAGGPWTRITNGAKWDDKPQWSADGKTIYFLSGQGGFFNVWGIRFDPIAGKKMGVPFRVTNFESPRLMVPHFIQPVALSLTQDHLILTLEDVSGSIWMLDNVDQ